MTTNPACAYCGTTSGLRVAGTDHNGKPDDFICAGCFTGTDTGPCFDDLPLAAPEIDAALAALAAYADSTNRTELWLRFVAVEHLMNYENANGRFDSSEAIRVEMNRISREVGGRIRAEADAISPFSKANWAATKAARATLTEQAAA